MDSFAACLLVVQPLCVFVFFYFCHSPVFVFFCCVSYFLCFVDDGLIDVCTSFLLTYVKNGSFIEIECVYLYGAVVCSSDHVNNHGHDHLRGMVSLVAGKNAGEKRDTEETAEEKRRRKAQIKQSKRVSQPYFSLLFAFCPLACLST